MQRIRVRLALTGVLALALSVGAGLAAGGAFAGGKTAAVAKKKRASNKARTFQNGANQAIPDDPPGASFPGQLDSTIRVGPKLKGKAVADVNVSVRISHPETDDLDLFLISPQGATVLLASANAGQIDNTGYGSGEAGCNGAMTTFDDETPNFISNASIVNEPGEILSPWAATVEPLGFPLNINDGNKARGVWTLRVLDFQNGEEGFLHCWKLRIKPRAS